MRLVTQYMPRTVGMYSTNCRVVCYERSAALIGCLCWCGAKCILSRSTCHALSGALRGGVCCMGSCGVYRILSPSICPTHYYMVCTVRCPDSGFVFCLLCGLLWGVLRLVTKYMPRTFGGNHSRVRVREVSVASCHKAYVMHVRAT